MRDRKAKDPRNRGCAVRASVTVRRTVGFAAMVLAAGALAAAACAQGPAQREWLEPEPAQVRLETRIPAECRADEAPRGRKAVRVVVPDMDCDEKACAFSLSLPKLEEPLNTARLWLRGSDKTRRVEVVFRTPEGNYGTEFALTGQWREVVLGPREAHPLLGTAGGRLVLSRATQVRLCFGAWQGHSGGPHEVSMGPLVALAAPVAAPAPTPVTLERPRVPLPLQPFTVELLDLARGRWVFTDALGQHLQLDEPLYARAFASSSLSADDRLKSLDPSSQDALRLAYLCCDPEYPEDLQHASLRLTTPVSSTPDSACFALDEPYFSGSVNVRRTAPGAYRAELTDLRLGPATAGDRYLAGLYVLEGARVCPLQLVAQDSEALQVRLTSDRVGHVFNDPEPVTVRVLGVCPGASESRLLSFSLKDYASGAVLWRGSRRLEARAHACTALSLTLPLKRYGIFELTAEGWPQPVALRLCRLPAVRRVGPQLSTIGMNVFQQQIWWYAYQVPLMARAGVRWVRPWLAWENVWSAQQPTAADWDTRALDAALRRLRAHGLEYQAILFKAPQWATNPGWSAPPEERLGPWSDYVRRIVTQYKDRIRYWEIWNEPDLMWPEETRHSGTHYVAVLKSAWEAAKAADPDCRILGLSHAGYMEWLEKVARLGAEDYYDIATIHSYAAPAEYHAAVTQRRDVLRRCGGDKKPLWINEFGATAYDFSPEYSRKYACSEVKQASVLTANYALSLSEDPRMKAFWFCTYDPRDAAHESGWAWDAGIGVLYLGFLPKLAYPALAGVARELDGRACLGRVTVAEHALPDRAVGLRQVAFAGPVSVVWADHPERARAVPAVAFGCLPTETVRVRDAYTNPVAAGPAGTLQLDLSRGPLYVEGSAQLAALARAEATVGLPNETLALAPGETRQLALRVPREAEVSLQPSPGLPVTARLRPATETEQVLVLKAEAGAGRSSGRMQVRCRLPRGSSGLVAPSVVERELTVTLGEPNLIRDGDLPSASLSQWTPERSSAWSWDAAVSHSGPGSLRLDAPFDRRLVHWKITPAAGRPMKLRAWARSRDLSGATVTLNLAFFGDKWLGSWCLAATGPTGTLETGWQVLPQPGRLPSGTADWTPVEAVLPAAAVPPGAATAAFYIDAKGGGSGTIWFDDLDLWQPADEK